MDLAEKRFWTKLQGKMPRMAHAQRIETTTGTGVPDLNICAGGLETWVELKMVNRNCTVLLRKEQHAWIKRRHAVGGKVMVWAHNPVTSSLWYFAGYSIKVEPYGTNEKYVNIISAPTEIWPMSQVGSFLQTILFTSYK